MGVHPGCPVSSIVAASLVAVETDVGETISAAKVSLCVVSGLLELLRSFLQAPFPTSAFTGFSSPVLRCWSRVLLHIMWSASRSSQELVFHVSLAAILGAQLWAACGSPSRRQLSTENVFWDTAILHAVDMPQPTQPALSEQGEHAQKVCSGQDLGVGHSVLPGYATDTADASQVEGIESFLLSDICDSRLAAVHQCADSTDIVYCHLDLHCQFGVSLHS